MNKKIINPLLVMSTLCVGLPQASAADLFVNAPFGKAASMSKQEANQSAFQTRLNKLRQSADVKDVAVVKLTSDFMQKIGVAGEITLNMFDNDHRTLKVKSINNKSQMGVTSQNITATANNGYNSVQLINIDGHYTGTIRVGGQLYKVSHLNGPHHSIRMMNYDLMQDHDHNYDENALVNQFDAATPAQVVPEQTATLADSGAEYTVIVAYTANFAADAGDVAAYMALLELETNTAYNNSNVSTSVKIVHSYQTGYTGTGSFGTDLTNMANSNDQYGGQLQTLRDQYGADLMILMTGNSGYGGCGQARAIGANASNAVAVAKESCGTGYYSFGHEIGHLFGARHIITQDPSTTPFSYGHGYCNVTANTWRSVMAYNCESNEGGPRIQQWSNPDIFKNGQTTGSAAQQDNARVHDVQASTIANFRVSGGGTTTPALDNNTALTISDSTGGNKEFTFSVPSGATDISIKTSGGTGDADLHVKLGSGVSTTNYDCRPYVGGNVETCPLTQSGEYSILVNAYSSYSGVNLVGSYTTGGGSTLPIEESKINLSGNRGTWQHFTIEAPADASNVTVTMSGGAGDADLYVREGSQPTSSTYDCRPYKSGNAETCTIKNTAAAIWHYSVYAYSSFSGVSLAVTID
jgi:hypothetical protein